MFLWSSAVGLSAFFRTIRCPTLAPESINLTTVLPLAEQLSPAEKLQLIEHFARELQATAPSFQAQP